jgi:DNA-binding XRE family transcriptional regulator
MATPGSHQVPFRLSSGLLNQYRSKQITLQQLASLNGVSVTTIWRELKRRGLSRGSRRGRPPSFKKRSLVLSLAAEGWTRRQIADHLRVTPEWVRSILAEHGMAVSLQILRCGQCGAVLAKGHMAYQGEQAAVCLSCLQSMQDATFSQRLKAHRLARNFSLAELSTRSGLSRAAIGSYERGLTHPSPSSAGKLAHALGISEADLN